MTCADGQAAKKPAGSAEAFKAFMHVAPDGFILLDSDLNLLEINAAALALCPRGTRKEDIVGKHTTEIVPGIRQTGRCDKYLGVLRTGKPFFADDVVPHPKFGEGHLAVRAFRVGDGLAIILTDISERKLAEGAFKESEQRFRELTDNLPSTFFAMDSDFKYTYWNKASEELTGISAEDALGKSLYELFPDIRGTKAEDLYLRVLRTRRPATVENEYELTGRKYVFELAAYPSADGVAVLAADITERKRMEEELEGSRANFRGVVDDSADGILVVDKEGVTRYVNPAAASLFGRSQEAVTDTPFGLPMVPGEKVEVDIVHAWGRPGVAEMRTALTEWHGEPAYLAMLRDVTERKKAAEALRKEHEFISALLDTPSMLVAVLSKEGRIVRFNRACAELTGYDRTEAEGKQAVDLLFPAQAWEKMSSLFRGNEHGVAAGPEEMPLRTSVGRECLIEWRWSLLPESAGGQAFLICTGVDTTERRRMEQRLLQSEKLSSLGELIAGAAHELNNPLTGVVGFSQMVARSPDCPAAIKDDLGKIDRSAQRCKAVVENLLSFARQRAPERNTSAITDLLNATMELLAYQHRVANIEVVREYLGPLPKVSADSNQLQQVFVNIMTNAAQAMQKAHGRGRLVVRARSRENMVRVEFADDGPGVPRGQLTRLFDPFFTTKPQGEGTGLGLSVCYGIVTAHNGGIWVESEEGEGATFVIELPAAEPPVEEQKPTVTKTQLLRIKQRVLAVDDEAVVLNLVRRILSVFGLEVITADSIQKALSLLEKETVDVVVCDLRMPGGGGEELYDAIASRNPGLARRMVFCTGDTVSRNAHDFLRRTGCPVVTKPFNASNLLQALAGVQREGKEDPHEEAADV